MSGRLLELLLVLLVLSVPASAAAAPQEGDPGDRVRGAAGAMLTANFKLGPFHLSPSLLTTTGIGSVPNQRQQDDPERLEVDGFFATTPRLRAALPVGSNHTVTVGSQAGMVWYRQFNQEDQVTYSVNGDYAYSGSWMQLSLGERYFRGGYSRFTPLDADAPPDTTLETDEWVPYTRRGRSAEVDLSMSERLGLTVGGEHRTVRYDDHEVPETGLPDNTIVSLDTSLDMALTSFSTVGAVYEWQRADYQDRNSFRDSRTQTLGLRYAWSRPRSLRWDFVAGYRRIDPDNAATVPYRGWNFVGNLSGALFDRLQAGLQVSRSTFRSSYGLNLYGVRQGGRATLNFAASRNIRLTGSVQYFVHDYPEDSGAGTEAGVPREDVLLGYSAGAAWAFGRVHSLNLAVGKSQRDSNVQRFTRTGLLFNFGYFFVY